MLVERFVRGDEHRLLVVGGRVVAAARGETAWVTGDGRASVVELVDAQINTDPRRGLTEDLPLNLVETCSDEAILLELQRQGLSPQAVPAAGRRVLIQRNGNVAIDCTDQVHPEVAHAVALAARVVGLDIAGVDLVAEDIGRPLHEQGGAVVEVNAGPGLLMHLKPAVGTPRPVGRAIVEHLFAERRRRGRIPIVGIAGSRGTTRLARLVARLLQLRRPPCRPGLPRRRVPRRPLHRAPATRSRFEHGHRLLTNRMLTAAVFENGAEAILRDGLAYDRCAVGVVTDLGGAAALADYDVARRRAAAEGAAHPGRRRARRRRRSAQRGRTRHRRAGALQRRRGDPVWRRAGAAGDRCAARAPAAARCSCRAAGVVLATGSAELRLAPLRRLTREQGEGPRLDPETLLAAIASAWALDLAPELIVAGIETFDPELARDALAA